MNAAKTSSKVRPIFLEVRQGSKRTFLESAKIIHLEASSNYTTIYAEGRSPVMVAKVLKKYQQLLGDYGFIRISKSILINSKRVRSINDDGCVVMENDAIFYPSRRRKGILSALICTSLLLIGLFPVSAQIGSVGINTSTPAAMLHVKDSSVLFTGNPSLIQPHIPPPASGPGIRMMWYPSRAAFRAGRTEGSQWDMNNIGNYSAAFGINTSASGDFSFATGFNSSASGERSVALGCATASGGISFASGLLTLASGATSTAMGVQTTASGSSSFAAGGISIASGNSSTALGHRSIASGIRSFAVGDSCSATNWASISIGKNCLSGGQSSVAMGSYSTASGPASIALGDVAIASQPNSVAIGRAVDANTNNLIAVGRFNLLTASNPAWSDTDHLFVIGNGSGFGDRHNALTVLKNGKVGIGTSTPKTKLHITEGTDASVTSDVSGYVVIGPTDGANIVLDENEILARNDGSVSTLHIQTNGGILSLCQAGNGFVGIGNNTPLSKLHVSGGSDAGLEDHGIAQFGVTTATNIVIDDNEILARFNGNTSDLTLQREGGDINMVELGGRVGIGINNANSKLQVTGGSPLTNLTGPGQVIFGPTSGINMVFDGQHLQARNNNAANLMFLQSYGGNLSLCQAGGKVIIGSAASTEELNVAGDGIFTGNVTAVAFNTSSDIRYKTNIRPIENALAGIHSLNGITYDWDKENFPQKEFSDKRQIGLSAQEIEKVYPEMVTTDSEGYKTVDYSRLTPVLIEAVKELSAELNELKAMVYKMQEKESSVASKTE